MDKGWVKLHRKMMDDPEYLSDKFCKRMAWIDLLLLANYGEGQIYKRGIKVELKRGQIGWSVRDLASRWKWSRQAVERWFDELEKEHQITRTTTNVTSLITIVNYEKYQLNETDRATESPKSGPQNLDSVGPQNGPQNSGIDYSLSEELQEGDQLKRATKWATEFDEKQATESPKSGPPYIKKKNKNKEEQSMSDKNVGQSEITFSENGDDIAPKKTEGEGAQKKDKKKMNQEKNKKYVGLAQVLAGIIQTKRNVKISNARINSWSNDFRLLVENDEVDIERVRAALRWYKDNIGGEYVHVIQSGAAFREKFIAMELRIEATSNNGKPKKKLPPNNEYRIMVRGVWYRWDEIAGHYFNEIDGTPL